MNKQINELIINGQIYVLKGSEKDNEPAESMDGLEYKIVRTLSAGVFAGYIEEKNGQNVVLLKARRLWYWSGAASLSQLAIDGTSKPKDCKFPEEVSRIELTQAIEILDVTAKAKKSIESVSVWKA
jgi:hypothetical protein